MKTYAQALKDMKELCEQKIKALKKHRQMFGIANGHARSFAKNHKELEVRTSYMEHMPCVDIDVYLGKHNTIKEVYPLVDALIRDPRLDMYKTLPKVIKGEDLYVTCQFKKKGSKTAFPMLRLYLHIEQSQVCVPVGTGKYEEITRIACGHYDDNGNFVEDADENSQ